MFLPSFHEEHFARSGFLDPQAICSTSISSKGHSGACNNAIPATGGLPKLLHPLVLMHVPEGTGFPFLKKWGLDRATRL
jgi:hypothetical protein